MQEIDLGEVEKIVVKKGAESFELSAPAVFQIESFQAKMKDADGGELKLAREFFVDMGMPEKAAKELSINQFNRLIEGVIGNLKKK